MTTALYRCTHTGRPLGSAEFVHFSNLPALKSTRLEDKRPLELKGDALN